MTDHECVDWWRSPSGALVCRCGKSKRPNDDAAAPAETSSNE